MPNLRGRHHSAEFEQARQVLRLLEPPAVPTHDENGAGRGNDGGGVAAVGDIGRFRKVTHRTLRIPSWYVDEMTDKSVRDALAAFVAERDWSQFHTPENLAKSIAIEAGELLECFQWNADADPRHLREELADVLTYCLLLADRIGADADEIVLEKLAVTRQKYPVEKARGSSTKYDHL